MTTYRDSYTSSSNMLIALDSSGDLDLNDRSLIGLTNAQIQAKLSGICLFYETQDEVADIIDTIGVEAGGTFTSDSEVLPNVDTDILCQ